VSDARIAEYLAKAEHCRSEARRASTHDEKTTWLLMAEEWLKLSRSVVETAAQAERLVTRVDGNTHPVHSKIVLRRLKQNSGLMHQAQDRQEKGPARWRARPLSQRSSG